MPNLNVAPSLDLTAFLIYLIVHSLTYNLFYYIQPLFIYLFIYKLRKLFYKFCELNFSFNIL